MKNEIVRKIQESRLSAMAEAFEFLLYSATEGEDQILLEVMERRVERITTIVCSANRIRPRLTRKSP